MPEMQGVLEGWFAARAALTMASSAALPFAIDVWPFLLGTSVRAERKGQGEGGRRAPRTGFGLGYRTRCPTDGLRSRGVPMVSGEKRGGRRQEVGVPVDVGGT